MGRTDHKDNHSEDHDRGLRKSEKRSKRSRKIQSLKEWIDIVNSGDDLEDYLYEADEEYYKGDE